MKAGEIKIRISNSLFNLIDTYFGGSALNEKFINSTLKIIVKQKINMVDSMLSLFADQNGDINAQEIVKEYANMIDEQGFVFDLKKYVDNDMVRNFIPDKILIIKRDDILNLIN